jgi:hypothetical protein
MYFYQSQWWDDGNKFGELRKTREEAIDDLAVMGCPVEKLVEDDVHPDLMYVPGMGYGIAIVRV